MLKMKNFVRGLIPVLVLAIASVALAVTNAQWLAMTVDGPAGTVTIEDALTTIQSNPGCTPEVDALCDYWLNWSGDPVGPAQQKVQAGWDTYNVMPINWIAVRDALDCG